jgi:hypothetical protein
MLPDALLKDYADKFYGFGTWNAKIWFIGIEEAGGWEEADVQHRLEAWKKQKRELEDAPSFYPDSGNHRWHEEGASIQSTWKQLIRMLLVGRGNPDTDEAILDYQRSNFGRCDGRECLAELLPLPSPSTTTWKYGNWSNLPWLKRRGDYQTYVMLERSSAIQQMIEKHRPKVVIFYASTWHRLWGLVARGVWTQAIDGKLMGLERDGISFYVTRHPRAESDGYFRQIGAFLNKEHGNRH